MDLDADPSWLIRKAEILEVVWVPTEVFVPSEVAKPVPPSELVLVCWGYFEVEDFHSESVVAVVVRAKFVSVVEVCFCARCGKSDSSHFLSNQHKTRKEVSSGSPS